MSRTIKDLPYTLWMCERLNRPYPDPWRRGEVPYPPYEDRAARDAWWDTYSPSDPAVPWWANRHSSKHDRRLAQHRYRANVRGLMAKGRYDDIGAPRSTKGWHDWCW